MSMPLNQQPLQAPPPPPMAVTLQPYNAHSSQASIGPVIAVLVVIIILGVIAVMMGRLCTGRRIMGYGHYDIETWAETKCSTCIDGSITPPPPLRLNVTDTSSLPTPEPVRTHNGETTQEEGERATQNNS